MTREEQLESLLITIVERWRNEYHCCANAEWKAKAGKAEDPAHSTNCPWFLACLFLELTP